jgi:voltage-gated potassium channel
VARISTTRFEDRFRRRTARAIARGTVFRYLVGATVIVSVGAGTLVRLVDPKDFHSWGDGLWWAIVTLATVGYGDIVPHTAWGRVIGSATIVFGVTFLTLLTAIVTSYFVASSQDATREQVERERGEDVDDTQRLLREILARLDALDRDRERR